MNKKLIAVAVAGMFVAPAAFAQTTVTITGKVMASFGQYKVSGRAAGATGANGETQVRDESSRILFLMREDLGGGMAAIGKFDLRFASSDGGVGGNTGESYVGLTSPTWGTIALGKFDFHYGNTASFTGVHAGLQTNPTSIMDVAGGGGAVIANQTRTNNAIRYGSPKFGDMFEVIVGYSANPTAASATQATTASAAGAVTTTVANQAENDLRSLVRKGSAWNIQPKLYGKNWEVSYSYWSAKPDIGINGVSLTAANLAASNGAVAPAAVVKHRGDALYGWYMWGGLRVGLAYNRSKVDTTAVTSAAGVVTGSGATTNTSNRKAWGLPISYNWGNHTVYFDYNRAGQDNNALSAAQIAAGTTDNRARFLGLTYAYDLSKRTTAAVSYAGIKNGNAAVYNLFSGNAGLVAGEDPRSIHVTLQHRY
jgi:predicted porin